MRRTDLEHWDETDADRVVEDFLADVLLGKTVDRIEVITEDDQKLVNIAFSEGARIQVRGLTVLN